MTGECGHNKPVGVKAKTEMKPFEQFRDAYPATKREDGARARAIFTTALTKAPMATLLEALDAHTRSAQWETPRYIPWMTNWLLGERWRHTLTPPAATMPPAARLSPADEAQRWRSLSPQEQLRRLGVKR
jgi:hypothetical protein